MIGVAVVFAHLHQVVEVDELIPRGAIHLRQNPQGPHRGPAAAPGPLLVVPDTGLTHGRAGIAGDRVVAGGGLIEGQLGGQPPRLSRALLAPAHQIGGDLLDQVLIGEPHRKQARTKPVTVRLAAGFHAAAVDHDLHLIAPIPILRCRPVWPINAALRHPAAHRHGEP